MREVSAISGRGEQKSNDKAFISTHVSRGPISIFYVLERICLPTTTT